jgi:putative ABC transport system permease protein
MYLMQGVLIALESLWAHKLRTILTLLGNIVGVMSIMAVVSIMSGADAYIENEMVGAGSGIFSVERVNPIDILSDFDKFLESLNNPKITYSDLAFLRERVTLAEYMDANLSARTDARYRSLIVKSIGVQGRSEYYSLMERYDLKDGRHFTGPEVTRNRQVAVIGFDVADRLYPSLDPINKEIRIAGTPFQIIGVLAQKPRGLGGNPNLTVIIPITAYGRVFGTRQSLSISVKPISLDRAADCVDQTRVVMRSIRHLGPKREDNFGIQTGENLLKIWSEISKVISRVLIGILSISLVVSGIIIMNVMLVSVTERTWEIGIRKALGARQSNILWQFLVEAIMLSMVGGILGIAAGLAVSAAFSLFTPLPFTVELWSIAISLAVTFIVGMFFGAYPAAKAARLDPIEALRYE